MLPAVLHLLWLCAPIIKPWCSPDANVAVSKEHGCKSHESTLWTKLFPINEATPVTFIDCGANKGYAIVDFLTFFAPHLQLTHRWWYEKIIMYARDHNSKGLAWAAAGACNEKDTNPSSRSLQALREVRIHAFELNDLTANLLNFMAGQFNLSSMLTVHNQPVSDSIRPVCVSQKFAGYEGTKIRTRRCNKNRNSTTIDDFLAHTNIAGDLMTEIDTEGHDGNVLLGMRAALTARRIRYIRFEYSSKWPSGLFLKTINWMHDEANYVCYFVSSLIAISGTCWLDEMDFKRWSNVMCVHSALDIEVVNRASKALFRERNRPRTGKGRQ